MVSKWEILPHWHDRISFLKFLVSVSIRKPVPGTTGSLGQLLFGDTGSLNKKVFRRGLKPGSEEWFGMIKDCCRLMKRLHLIQFLFECQLLFNGKKMTEHIRMLSPWLFQRKSEHNGFGAFPAVERHWFQLPHPDSGNGRSSCRNSEFRIAAFPAHQNNSNMDAGAVGRKSQAMGGQDKRRFALLNGDNAEAEIRMDVSTLCYCPNVKGGEYSVCWVKKHRNAGLSES